MNNDYIKKRLDKAVIRYNTPEFIENDPIQIPYRYTAKEDKEIAGLLAATIAWGNRKMIINNCNKLMDIMENAPHQFVLNYQQGDKDVEKFVHRTFNGIDLDFFLLSLQNIYKNYGGLEKIFTNGYLKDNTIFSAIDHFRTIFLSTQHSQRSERHISNVLKNSAAKRINMYLRWMVRKDENEVDFGLWKDIPAAALMLPLDVHSGNISRECGILNRKQNDWKAVEEVTAILRTFDPKDPVKYDFALFGIGVNGDSWE